MSPYLLSVWLAGSFASGRSGDLIASLHLTPSKGHPASLPFRLLMEYTREELPAGLAFQLWHWWDEVMNRDDRHLSPERRAVAGYLHPRLRLVAS